MFLSQTENKIGPHVVCCVAVSILSTRGCLCATKPSPLICPHLLRLSEVKRKKKEEEECLEGTADEMLYHREERGDMKVLMSNCSLPAFLPRDL